MPRHVDAWMDGVALSSLGPILVHQVHEDPPSLEVTEGERPGRYGTRLLTRKRQSLKVAIEVVILERFDLSARTRLAERLAAWADGSVLTLSHHPGRRLQVRCTGIPALGEARDYTSALRIEWTAHAVPYWEDSSDSGIALNGTDNSGTLPVPGTARTPVSLTVTPTGGALTEFHVYVGDSSIVLTGLNLSRGTPLIFSRDARDDLAISGGGESLLSARTSVSADDLLADPGDAAVRFTANVSCLAAFSVRGRWI